MFFSSSACRLGERLKKKTNFLHSAMYASNSLDVTRHKGLMHEQHNGNILLLGTFAEFEQQHAPSYLPAVSPAPS